MDSPNSLHPFLASNSDHAMNHLGDYNCSVRTYAKVSSLSFKFQVSSFIIQIMQVCKKYCTVVTSQMIRHMV